MSRRPIGHGDHVRSAEGTIYVVRHVDESSATADLVELDAFEMDGGATLPLAELKRVTKRKAVPIENMPPIEERPRCPYCNKRLRPRVDDDRVYEPSYRIVRRWWAGDYHGYRQLFDTKKCAIDFAAAAHKAGYRIIRRKSATASNA